MKLKNGYEITGTPNKVEYQKNENGLYTVDIKDYVCIKPNGQKYHCFIRIPNAKIPVEDDEGTIEFNLNDIEFYNANNQSSDNTIFEFVVPFPDVVENENLSN